MPQRLYPGDYDALRAIWPTLAPADVHAQLAELNAKRAPSTQHRDIAVADIEAYLSFHGLLTELEDWLAAAPPIGAARTAARELLRIVNSPRIVMIEAADQQNFAAYIAIVAALPLDGAHKDALTALGAVTQPWWEANGFAHQVDYPQLVEAGLWQEPPPEQIAQEG